MYAPSSEWTVDYWYSKYLVHSGVFYTHGTGTWVEWSHEKGKCLMLKEGTSSYDRVFQWNKNGGVQLTLKQCSRENVFNQVDTAYIHSIYSHFIAPSTQCENHYIIRSLEPTFFYKYLHRQLFCRYKTMSWTSQLTMDNFCLSSSVGTNLTTQWKRLNNCFQIRSESGWWNIYRSFSISM